MAANIDGNAGVFITDDGCANQAANGFAAVGKPKPMPKSGMPKVGGAAAAGGGDSQGAIMAIIGIHDTGAGAMLAAAGCLTLNMSNAHSQAWNGLPASVRAADAEDGAKLWVGFGAFDEGRSDAIVDAEVAAFKTWSCQIWPAANVAWMHSNIASQAPRIKRAC